MQGPQTVYISRW